MAIEKILTHGALGLSCILAVATYYLIKKEQGKPRPNKQILRAIYIYMILSVAFTVLGLYREWRKDDTTIKIESFKDTNAQKLKSARDLVSVLLDQKGGQIQQLSELTKDSASQKALDNIIVNLMKIDSAMLKVIEEDEKANVQTPEAGN